MDLTGSIVFSSGKQADYDIFTLDLDTGQVSQLTSGPYWNDFAKWSPDGTKILFISNRSGTQDVWLMDADGNNQRPLTQPGKWHSYPSWAPDGQSIVFS
ncbi:MAG TPA: hypothetical protein P5160_09845, partial [Candidatus Omnitrophota bacterium]|nr:hypothetical protein [Candidatus Omnitrophota bacterium]